MDDPADILAALDHLPPSWGLTQTPDGVYVAISNTSGRKTLGERNLDAAVAQTIYVAENEALGLFAPVRVPEGVQTAMQLDITNAAQSNDGLLAAKLKRKKGQSQALKRYAKDKKKHWRG